MQLQCQKAEWNWQTFESGGSEADVQQQHKKYKSIAISVDSTIHRANLPNYSAKAAAAIQNRPNHRTKPPKPPYTPAQTTVQ
ncbi:MAG: hypothetical protein ACKPKO_35130, partial [Candidatus Fonsibacter sp.]